MRTRKSIGGETPAVIVDVPLWPVPAALYGVISLRNAKLGSPSPENAHPLARASGFAFKFIPGCLKNGLLRRERLRLPSATFSGLLTPSPDIVVQPALFGDR
jgi:hypothetical protein